MKVVNISEDCIFITYNDTDSFKHNSRQVIFIDEKIFGLVKDYLVMYPPANTIEKIGAKEYWEKGHHDIIVKVLMAHFNLTDSASVSNAVSALLEY